MLAVVGGIVFDEAVGPGMVTGMEGVGDDDVVALVSAAPEGGLVMLSLPSPDDPSKGSAILLLLSGLWTK